MMDEHVPCEPDLRAPFCKEDRDLSLSTWMGISGAAISTGLGRNTSLGLALLAGLSNLRLGVWWTPVTRSPWRILVSPTQWVQVYLVREFLGLFRGPATVRPGKDLSPEDISKEARKPKPWWWRCIDDPIEMLRGQNSQRLYLTDGGHFENSGVYELVRRRVPMIIACDNGADPDYRFEDIVDLTRKLRIDLNADLEFLPWNRLNELFGEKGVYRSLFGEISELLAYSREKLGQGPYAAVARVRIAEQPGVVDEHGVPLPAFLGTLVLIKPRLSGLEMLDLLDYNRANVKFPQQSTGDQFFDEAQWESYYRLGEHIAGLIFSDSLTNPEGERDEKSEPRWLPYRMEPIRVDNFSWFGEDWSPVASEREQAEKKDDKAFTLSVSENPGTSSKGGGGLAAGLASFSYAQLLTTGVASLGALGATLGISHSLTSTVITEMRPGNETSLSMSIDEKSRDILSQGIAVRLDPGISAQLDTIIEKLDALLGQQPGPGPGQPDDAILYKLEEIRALLARIAARPDPAALERLQTELRGLRGDVRALSISSPDLAVLGTKLDEIIRALGEVKAAVNRSSPRQNSRSGQ